MSVIPVPIVADGLLLHFPRSSFSRNNIRRRAVRDQRVGPLSPPILIRTLPPFSYISFFLSDEGHTFTHTLTPSTSVPINTHFNPTLHLARSVHRTSTMTRAGLRNFPNAAPGSADHSDTDEAGGSGASGITNAMLKSIVEAAVSSALSHTQGENAVGAGRPSNLNGKPRITRYSGDKAEVRVEAWLNAYEVATQDFSERDRINQLVRYLEGSAITWFSEEVIPCLEMLEWDDVKQLMIKRHGQQHISPIVAATNRKLKEGEQIQTYFDEKMRFLRQTNLTERDQASILTDGVPRYVQKTMIAARVTTTSDWLVVALDFEALYGPMGLNCPPVNRQQGGRNGHPTAQAFNNQRRTIQVFAASGEEKQKKKPPKPCKICAEAGKSEAWHWHSDCPNKGQKAARSEAPTPQPTAQIRTQSFSAQAGNGTSGQSNQS